VCPMLQGGTPLPGNVDDSLARAKLEEKPYDMTIKKTDESRQIERLERQIVRLEKEIAWWAGEGQEDREEIIRWRHLVGKKRTPSEEEEMKRILYMIKIENENVFELRERLKIIDASNSRRGS